MPKLRRPKPALWIAAVLFAVLPGSASGAVTIGSNLAATPVFDGECGNAGCTAASRALPPTSTAAGGPLAPSDGVVVRWRIKSAGPVTPVALRITRPGDSDSRTGAGTGPTVTPAADQTSTFEVRLPIQAGDSVGIECCHDNKNLVAVALTPGASLALWVPPLEDGGAATTAAAFALDNELLVNADIEVDADGDGFGDETQDGCPTEASTQIECDPPQTEISKSPANKTGKPKVKYKFTSNEPGSSFECKLKGKGLEKSVKRFRDCESPRKYRHLAEGKFKFSVRAVDAAGNVDPSPATDEFKVVD